MPLRQKGHIDLVSPRLLCRRKFSNSVIVKGKHAVARTVDTWNYRLTIAAETRYDSTNMRRLYCFSLLLLVLVALIGCEAEKQPPCTRNEDTGNDASCKLDTLLPIGVAMEGVDVSDPA